MRRSTAMLVGVFVLTAAVLFWPRAGVLSGGKSVWMTVWGMPFEDRLFRDIYARGFERERPDVRVEYGRFADVRLKYNAWHAQRRGPEVMRVEATWYIDMARRGLLEPLTPYIDDPVRGLTAERFEKIPEHLRRILEVDGEIYGLPQDTAVFGLLYNKDIFDAYNAANPDRPLTYPSEQWTWDDFRRAAKALTVRDARGRLERAGFGVALWAWPFLTLQAQAGGAPWSPDGLTCTVDDEGGVAALRLLRVMQREDRSFDPLLADYTSGMGPDILFGLGRVAMLMDGSWRVANIENNYPGLRFAVAPLPKGARRAVVTGSIFWCISRHAKHKDEAWEMIRWLTDDAQAARYWDTMRLAPPANLAVIRGEGFRRTGGMLRDPADPSRGFEVPPMSEEQFADRAAWIEPTFVTGEDGSPPPGFLPMHELQGDLFAELASMLVSYLSPTSDQSPEEALRGVAGRMNELVDRRRRAAGLPPVPRGQRNPAER